MDLASLSPVVADAVSGYEEVLAVFVFGSAAEARMHPRSDVDLAALFSEGCAVDRRLDLSLEIGSRVQTKIGRRVQVLVLNHAHPGLAFRAIRGRLLLDRDPVARSLYAARTISRYHDYRRFLRQHVPAMEARAREGRFGTAR